MRKRIAQSWLRCLWMLLGGAYSLEAIHADIDLGFADHIFAYRFFVGTENGKIVCAGALKKAGIGKDVWGIAWIAVSPAKQKRGYGRKVVGFLIDQVAGEFMESEQGTLILRCSENNFSFYGSLGFDFVAANNNGRLYYKTINSLDGKGSHLS